MRLKSTLVMLCMFIGLFVINPINADAANTYTSGDYEYIVEKDGTATITAYKGNEVNLTIPSKLGNYSVRSIGRGAFFRNKTLKNIVVPENVNYIMINAFDCMGNCNIYIKNKNVKYEYIDRNNLVFSVGNSAIYKIQVISTSGSSTEKYYNDYYVKWYAEKNMQWKGWGSEVYYHNIDWSGPDSISFADTSDLTVKSSSELGINYLYMPQISLYDKEGNYMDGDSASNPFNDYGHVEFWVNRSPEANIPSGQTEFKFKKVYGAEPGMWSLTFSAAGTYYVHPVYVRKARTDCLASLYVDEHFIIGEPIKVVVEKTLYNPVPEDITTFIECDEYAGILENRQISDGDVITVTVPAALKSRAVSLKLECEGKPEFEELCHYLDQTSEIDVVSDNENTVAASSHMKFSYKNAGVRGYWICTWIDILRYGESDITVSNQNGYKIRFKIKVERSATKKLQSYFTGEKGSAYVKVNKDYSIDDFFNIEPDYLIKGESKYHLLQCADDYISIDYDNGTFRFTEEAPAHGQAVFHGNNIDPNAEHSWGVSLSYRLSDKEDLSNSTKPGSDNNNNNSDSNDNSSNSNNSNSDSTDNNDGSPIFIGNEDLSDKDNVAADTNTADDKEDKEKVKISLNVSDTFTMQKGKTVAVKLMKSSKKGDGIKDVNVTGGSKIVTAKVSGNSIKVKAKKSGTAKIKIVTNAGAEKTIKVKVSGKKVKPAISIKSKVSVSKGKSYRLTYSLKKIPASGKVTFASSNKKVATVSKTSGVIKGKKKGTAKITVKVDGKKVKTVKVSVK